ncbi:photosystem I P700 apoprotein A2 [Tanacetum coccineum]|uniref:Photosystem I P700 apoprotein A2 n=1 Tax=Tanacetum coccineum TaxID=301880 RepID=A0ABQ4WT34_9ASTR
METECFVVQKCRISSQSSFIRTLQRQWNLYAQNPDLSSHLFGTSLGARTAILTLLGGFHPQSQSLWLTDMAHHHLAIAFIFLIARHMYRTNFGIGHSMKDLLDAHIPLGGRLGRGHKGLYDTIKNLIHFQLGLALASLGVITSLVAQHMDYNPKQNVDNVLARMLEHKEAIISHLSWASLFLGFHTLGLYVHNDVMLAFGTSEKPILIEPIFAQWIQSAHGKTSYRFDILLSSTNGLTFNAGRSIWLSGWLNAINENSNSLFLTIGPGDFLVYHAIALGLHTTTLILVKGALDARGSKLMLDKKDFGFVRWPRMRRTLHYGRELIETLAWTHERTPLANLIRLREKPVALSIVQARLLGLAHFSVGNRDWDPIDPAEAMARAWTITDPEVDLLLNFTSSLSFCMVLKRKSGCPDIEEFFLQIEAGNLVGESLSTNLVGGTCSTLTSLFHNTSQPAYLEGADIRREEKGQGFSANNQSSKPTGRTRRASLPSPRSELLAF